MRKIAAVVSFIALAGTIVPSCAYLAGSLTLDQVKFWMLISTVIWFVTVPLWMDRAEE